MNTGPIGRYSCIFYLFCNPIRTENADKTLNCPFSYTGFSKQNGVGLILSNVITASHCDNITVRNVIANKNIGEMISQVRNAFRI